MSCLATVSDEAQPRSTLRVTKSILQACEIIFLKHSIIITCFKFGPYIFALSEVNMVALPPYKSRRQYNEQYFFFPQDCFSGDAREEAVRGRDWAAHDVERGVDERTVHDRQTDRLLHEYKSSKRHTL